MSTNPMAATSQDDVEAKRVSISAGCNRVVNNVSWGASGLVSFGAQNAVAIFCPKSARIITTLPGHKASVNCTHWLPSSKFAFRAKHLEHHYLLSGDADGVVFLWEFSLASKMWRQVLQLPRCHKKGVTCLTGLMLSQNNAIFASTSSDSTVSLWELEIPSTFGGECKLSRLETISVGLKPMVTLSLAELPGNSKNIILAMGGLDNKVHLYCGETTGQFVHACELKAHTDWIRSLDFSLPICINSEANSILLVSSSQDKGIRIWKISLRNSSADGQETSVREEISLTSYIEGPVIVDGSCSYQISLESLLIGHEDWVYSVQWQPPTASAEGNAYHQPQSLMSASMDKTMMIWQPEKKSGIWMNVVTVGELSHSALGFYWGHWSPDGIAILAHGYGGAFHMWKNIGIDIDDWRPQKVPSGHFASVTDITWARSGEFLLSGSHDQTSRIFAPWQNYASLEDGETWHEIARPQVHGHDINCLAIIQGKGNHRFVSGADEKVSRVVETTLSFLKTLSYARSPTSSFPEDLQSDVQILGANMSALGMSQKPIYAYDAVPVVLTEPPIEDQLAIWHTTHSGPNHINFMVTGMSCFLYAVIMREILLLHRAKRSQLWLLKYGYEKWVHGNQLVVMEFSHDDSMLLSVSRDRQFSVFIIRRGIDEISYQLLARQEAHTRIIWSCSWNPFGHEFATGSRDKTVKIWTI